MSGKKNGYQLQKIVNRFKEIDYVVRFEKGNFNTGYCILEDRKIIVVNKFHDISARIDTLLALYDELTAHISTIQSEAA